MFDWVRKIMPGGSEPRPDTDNTATPLGPSTGWHDHLVVILGQVIWGAGVIATKVSFTEISPLAFTFMRSIIAWPLLLAVMLSRADIPRFKPSDWWALLQLAVFGGFLNTIFWSLGLNLTEASNASLLGAVAPLCAMVLAALMGQDTITRQGLGGIAMALAGTFLIVTGGSAVHLLGKNLLGDLLILCGAATWAGYSVLVKKHLARFSVWGVSALPMMFSIPLLGVVAAPQLAAQRWAEVTWLGLSGLFYVGVVASSAGFLIWNWGLDRLGPNRCMLYSYVERVVTVFLAYLLLGEALTAAKLIGGAVVLAGVYVGQLRRIRA